MKKVSDGFIILKRYGDYKTACWILYNNKEGAIIEMPPFKSVEKPPFEKARAFFKKYKIFPKYAFLSHSHWDHVESAPLFRIEFPETKFVSHSSFFSDPYMRYLIKSSYNRNGPFDDVFTEALWQGDLGGEPVYLIHAPKHSPSDLMIVFRGAMITGDWYIGDLKDCNNLVPSEYKIKSINFLQNVIKQLNYKIHMLFSAHGDCFFYDADFNGIMEKTKINHKGRSSLLPARFEAWRNLPTLFSAGI